MAGDLAIAAAVFFSGAAGLIFQTVWFYRAALVLGSGVWAVTLVLVSFMAGLALGNLCAGLLASSARRPLMTYAALELIVGVAGLMATAVLPRVDALGSPFHIIVALAALIVPATAMGATLPLLVGAATREPQIYGSVLGRLYGLNTLGAVIGVVTAEFVLVSWIGVRGTAVVAAALNVLAAGLVRPWASISRGRGSAAATALVRRPRRVATLLGCAALAGAGMLALEVIWFRFLTLYVLSTTQAASLMLATVLFGIAGGSIAGGWISRRGWAVGVVPAALCLAGASVLASYLLFGVVTNGTQVGEWWRVLWFTACLALPAALLSGLVFTTLGDAIHRDWPDHTASTAWLTLANTIGAIAGAAAAALALLPRLGMEVSLFALAIAYGVAALAAVFALRPMPRSARIALPLAGTCLLVLLATFPFGRMTREYFSRAAAPYAVDGSTIVATREGALETIFLMEQSWQGQPIYHRLVTNGFSMTGTAVPGLRYMRYFGYWPMFVHKGPIERALVICYGVGVTAGAVLQIPSLQSLDIAELSPDIAAMSDVIYTPDRHPLRDPRTRLHLEDGRYFLNNSTERFDLITGEPPPPRTPGAANIYTREYFQLIYDRLAEGGIATYWLPVARPEPGTDIDTIVRAFCDVFDDCSLWNATPADFMLAGSRNGSGPATVDQFNAPWQVAGLQSSLREVGFERPEQIGATFLGDASYLRALTRETPPLTDDFPHRLTPSARASLSDPRLGKDPAVTARYEQVLDTARASAAFEQSSFIRALWPEALRLTSAAYFDEQRMINTVLSGTPPPRMVADLDAVLTNSTLRTLPLWLLGSDEVRQRLAERSTDGRGTAEAARGLRALTGRDYTSAASWFVQADRKGQDGNIASYLAYALCRSGRIEDARLVAAHVTPRNADEQQFWNWMAGRFGVGARD